MKTPTAFATEVHMGLVAGRLIFAVGIAAAFIVFSKPVAPLPYMASAVLGGMLSSAAAISSWVFRSRFLVVLAFLIAVGCERSSGVSEPFGSYFYFQWVTVYALFFSAPPAFAQALIKRWCKLPA
jgi:hypothetical protein